MSTVAVLGGVFPGLVYDTDGICLDRRRPPLTLDKMWSYPHRALVRCSPIIPNWFQIWAINDGVTIEDIAMEIQETALGYMLGGGGILLLATEREVVREVRSGMRCVIAVHGVSQRQAVANGKFLALSEWSPGA